MKGSGKWTITGLLIIMAGLTVSSVRGEMWESHVSIWVGQEVDLECDYNNSDTDARVWVKGRELLKFVNGTAVNNDRISLFYDSTKPRALVFTLLRNSSAFSQESSAFTSRRLRLVNASSDDQGTYICSVPGTPSQTHYFVLQVKETHCDAPSKLADGEYRSEIYRLKDSSRYKAWERVIYTCNKGYKMIGQAISTCSGTPDQWLPQDKPYCQPEFLDPLLKRLDSIEAELSAIKSRINYTVVDNQSTNDKNTSSMGSIENNQSTNDNNTDISPFMKIVHDIVNSRNIKNP